MSYEYDCVGCGRTGTWTIVYIDGHAGWQVYVLTQVANITGHEAAQAVGVVCEVVLGMEPGKVPMGSFQAGYRLCRDCAAKSDAKIMDLSDLLVGSFGQARKEPVAEYPDGSREVTMYRQPSDYPQLSEWPLAE